MAISGNTPIYRIVLSNRAQKYMIRMQAADAKRVRSALARLASDPDDRRLDVKPLTGRSGWRMRVGDYRIIFSRDDVVRILAIERIAPRGDVYKR